MGAPLRNRTPYKFFFDPTSSPPKKYVFHSRTIKGEGTNPPQMGAPLRNRTSYNYIFLTPQAAPFKKYVLDNRDIKGEGRTPNSGSPFEE